MQGSITAASSNDRQVDKNPGQLTPREARTGVVEGGGVGEVRKGLPVLGEEAVRAQLGADGHGAPRAQLAPHAARHRQARVTRHPHQLYPVRPLALLRRRAIVPVPIPVHCWYYNYYTPFLPTGKVKSCRQAAVEGCHNPTPCWTRQIQARPNQPWVWCSVFVPPAGSRSPVRLGHAGISVSIEKQTCSCYMLSTPETFQAHSVH